MKMPYQKLITSLIISLNLFLCFNYVSAISPNSGTWNFSSGSGLNRTADEIGYATSNPSSPEIIISRAITIVLSFLGVVFLGLMIYAGLTWMTAGGNEQTVDKAKKIIEESIIGLIVVIAAYAVAFFVINYFAQNTLG